MRRRARPWRLALETSGRDDAQHAALRGLAMRLLRVGTFSGLGLGLGLAVWPCAWLGLGLGVRVKAGARVSSLAMRLEYATGGRCAAVEAIEAEAVHLVRIRVKLRARLRVRLRVRPRVRVRVRACRRGKRRCPSP